MTHHAPVARVIWAVWLVGLTCVTACSSDDDADVAGDYSTMITSRDNGCNFPGWTTGESNTVQVTVTQSGNNVTATVNGLVALALEAALGGHVYTGRVSGGSLDLNLFGTRSNTTGNCTYTLNSEIHAEISDNVMTGQIDYTSATNGNPDCAAIERCRSFQDFNGIRAP